MLSWSEKRRGRERPISLQSWPAWAAIALHVFIALIYTTPWDNYLVATSVWWYDPSLVTGVTIGWVPIEEYTFFVLQPILSGLWLLFLMRRITMKDEMLRPSIRLWSLLPLGIIWIMGSTILVAGWQPGTYLSLILVWALPPIMLQLGFGADILWRYRRLVLFSIVSITLYLSLADALAINWGTWTIDPAQSVNIFLGGILPVEEFVFFLMTNILITFGIVLVLADASHQRLASFKKLIGSTKQDVSSNNVRRSVELSENGG